MTVQLTTATALHRWQAATSPPDSCSSPCHLATLESHPLISLGIRFGFGGIGCGGLWVGVCRRRDVCTQGLWGLCGVMVPRCGVTEGIQTQSVQCWWAGLVSMQLASPPPPPPRPSDLPALPACLMSRPSSPPSPSTPTYLPTFSSLYPPSLSLLFFPFLPPYFLSLP